jgi:hypothetical protein
VTPNPGGLPLPGNGAFSLTVASSPGSAPGLFAGSLGRASLPVGGITLLVDPARMVLTGPLPAAPSATIPLPIPANPALAGLSLYFQTVHVEGASTLGASNGVQVTIL